MRLPAPTALRLVALLLCGLFASAGEPSLGAAQRGGGRGGAAPERAGAGRAQADLALRYFRVADGNGDGWISFRESRGSMGLDRAQFAYYDRDRDGMIDPSEFRARYDTIVQRGGVFPAPVSESERGRPDLAGPAELVTRFDEDRDGRLGEVEVRAVLEAYGERGIGAEGVLEKLDRDGLEGLSGDELEGLWSALAPESEERRAERELAGRTLHELFSRRIPREERPGRLAQPPRIPGPVRPFERLDLDADGAVSRADLLALERPLQLPVRTNLVLAAIDGDGDGRLSEEELLASMAPPPRGQ